MKVFDPNEQFDESARVIHLSDEFTKPLPESERTHFPPSTKDELKALKFSLCVGCGIDYRKNDDYDYSQLEAMFAETPVPSNPDVNITAESRRQCAMSLLS